MLKNSQQKDPNKPRLQQSVTGYSNKYVNFSNSGNVVIILAIAVVVAAISLSTYFLINKKLGQPQTTLPKAVLILEEPKDQQATTSSNIKIVGKTNPESLVAAYTETQEATFESDTAGNFSGTLTLDEGPNEITFTAFGQDNNEGASQTKSVVYVSKKEL